MLKGIKSWSRHAVHSNPVRCHRWCAAQKRVAKLERHICRVTNEAKEIWEGSGMENMEESDYLEYEEIQIYDPESGPLSKRVKRIFAEEVHNSEIDVKETNYWFTPPPDGWTNLTRRLKKAEELPVEFAHMAHFGKGRMKVEDLHEGQILDGTVTDIWLYHGAEIDIGAEYDGMLPISPDEWRVIGDNIMPGDEFQVRVHKLQRPGLYRFPIHLSVVHEYVHSLITPPEEWESPIDLAWAMDQGWSMDDVARATGRQYYIPSYFPPRDPDMWAEQTREALSHVREQEKKYRDDDHPEVLNRDIEFVVDDTVGELVSN